MPITNLVVTTQLSAGVAASNAAGDVNFPAVNYNPQPTKKETYTTAQGPASASGNQNGVNTCLAKVQTISAGSFVDIDLTNFTDVTGQTAAAMVRLKQFLIHLVSVADDSVNGTACSSIQVGGPVNPPVQSALSTITTGGSITANTYYYVITSTTAAGESVISNQQSITTTGSTSTNTVNWAVAPDATGYKIYRSTSSGVYGASSLLTTIGSGATVTFSDTLASTSAGTPPSANTATVANVHNLDLTTGLAGFTIGNGEAVSHLNASAAGWTVSGTAKIIHIVNNDAVNAAVIELCFIGSTS